MKIKAIIYCRVSSDRQKNEGHGLESQEHRCREYARSRGYVVEKVFKDSFTGGGDFLRRPGMFELLGYLESKPYENFVIVFDDLKRLARDTGFYLKLKMEFKARGATVESPNFTFEATDENVFIETVLVAQGELERKQNRRQVIQKMKARLEAGYWPFNPIPGYVSVKVPGHGKVMHSVGDKTEIIKEALEGFATGKLSEKVDVQAFLQSKRYLGNKKIYIGVVNKILERAVIYAGFVEYYQWEVSRRRGHHKELISLDVLEKIEDRMSGKVKTKNRQDINPDFPARGYVLCADCLHPMTASWTTKPHRNYRRALYRCNKKGCIRCNKSTSAGQLDEKLEGILKSIKPSPQIIDLTKLVATNVWNQQEKLKVSERREMESQLREAKLKKDRLVDLITRSTSDRVVKSYEEEIEAISLEEEKLRMVIESNKPNTGFGTALDTVLSFLENPYSYWSEGGVNEKRLVLKLVFTEGLQYHFDNGFGTPELCCVLKVFEQIESSKFLGVEMGGIEPPCKERFK